MNTAIKVSDLSKKYLIKKNASYGQYRTLAETLSSIPRALTRKNNVMDEFWALHDISFSIAQGERVGIVGRNGAGKSTLLKLLSRISPPTTGRIELSGRLASLLEVGTGFHPELTGRENIFLNGAILGMTRHEIKKHFDEIVDFSGVERFISTPVKRYSSGMYVRLAFAVAAHLNPEILIVDEVLAVGDMDFQKKCLGKMEEVSKSQGKTILLVSHNMTAVKSLCNRSIWIDKGTLKADGKTDEIVSSYLKQNMTSGWERNLDTITRYGSGEVRGKSLQMHATSPTGETRESVFYSGDDLHITLTLNAFESLNKMNAACIIYDTEGTRIIDANMAMVGKEMAATSGQEIKVQWKIQNLLLNPGQYLVSFWIGQTNKDIDGIPEVLTLEVSEPINSEYLVTYPGKYRCNFQVSYS